jgi:hypothetical protein
MQAPAPSLRGRACASGAQARQLRQLALVRRGSGGGAARVVARRAAGAEAAAVQDASASSSGAAPAAAAAAAPTSNTWELDFCSRPLLDERGKKVWELLITDPERSFEYAQYFPNSKINSIEVGAGA